VINRLRFWLAGLIAPRVFYLPAGSEIDIDALAHGQRVIYIPPEFPPPAIHRDALAALVGCYRYYCAPCAHQFTDMNTYQTHDCTEYQTFPVRLTIATQRTKPQCV